MESIIEVQRQAHEEAERYQQALADILIKPTSGTRGNLRNEHKALDVLERITQRQGVLLDFYNDPQGLRAQELQKISAPAAAPGQDDLVEFYTRFNKIKDHHSQHPDLDLDLRGFLSELKQLVDGDGLQRIQVEGEEEEVVDPLDAMFSGEEGMGRFLDLYISHAQYINLRGAKRLSYVQYLDMLMKGKVEQDIDTKEREGAAYLEYIQGLHSYLLDFLRRSHPLENYAARLEKHEAEFVENWNAGKVEGWQRKLSSSTAVASVEGIWCPACQKSYAKQTVYDAHLTSKKHIKAAERLAAEGDTANGDSASAAAPVASTSTGSSRIRTAAMLTTVTEALLMMDPIPSLLNDSRQNVERKAALTAREREQELEEPAEEAPPVAADQPADEDDDEGRIYNPLKLPLGWDGKPIPYWLYKLHGLGVEYKCEICSDYVYMGRKAFDRHFQESRHAFGMRALGLPNTKHFHEITKIQDALSLAERLKHEGRQEAHVAERAEEFEDADGNVYDKKTYEDLKRQGLI